MDLIKQITAEADAVNMLNTADEIDSELEGLEQININNLNIAEEIDSVFNGLFDFELKL